MKTINFIFSGLFFFNVLFAWEVVNIKTDLNRNYGVFTNTKESFNNRNNPVNQNNKKYDYLQKKSFDSGTISVKKNIIGYDLAQSFYFSIGFTYERFFGEKNQFSIRIPLSVGTNYFELKNNVNYLYITKTGIFKESDSKLYHNGKIAGCTFDFSSYLINTKRINYFLGPYFEFGVFAYGIYNFGNYGPTTNLKSDGTHIAGGFQNGFLFYFNNFFTLQGIFRMGLEKNQTLYETEKVLTQTKFNLIFGFKF